MMSIFLQHMLHEVSVGVCFFMIAEASDDTIRYLKDQASRTEIVTAHHKHHFQLHKF